MLDKKSLMSLSIYLAMTFTLVPWFLKSPLMVDWITNNGKTEYRKEIKNLVTWCQNNNRSLNVSKTKDHVIVLRKYGRALALIRC